ncbi:MAG TPA: peptidyl-prolyl cis-trans isomerase [Eubacteriales bacterium]|nr:peptidyl-prolyl cis-trans isomerase [Eubacteriales bacterium]
MNKFHWKRLLCVLLALSLVLGAAACSLNDDEEATASDAETAYTDEELDQVAVQIGDYTITKGDIVDQYDYMVQLYSYYGMSTPTEDSEIESMQDSVISTLVSDKIQLYEADLMGITLTDEELADVEAQVEEEMQYYIDSFRADAEDEGAEDPDARALEIFQEQLDAAEMDMDVDGFREYIREEYMNDALKTALEAKVTADVTATDDEIQDYYDENLASQMESYTSTPTDYLSDAESFQMDGGSPVLYTPEGYVRIRSISITPEEDISDDYTTLKSDLDALAAEYGEAALDALAAKYIAQGADPATTTLNVTADEIEGGAEIISEYVEKKAQADELYEEYIKDARAKAEEAYAALEGGASFTDVLSEYGEDDLYTTYPSFVESGLLMYMAGDDSTWDEQLVKAAGLLKAGEYSAIIQIDDVFYILQLVGDETAGAKELSDVYDDIKAVIISQNADTLWNETLDAWENDTSIATYYEDVYRDIGK